MAKKKTVDEPLVLNEKAKNAFEELSQQTQFLYRYIEETMRKEIEQNKEFAQLIKNLLENEEKMRKKISMGQPISREELIALTNNIINLNEKLKQPLKTAPGEILTKIMAVGTPLLGRAKKINDLPEAQQMEKIQNDFASIVGKIQQKATVLVENVKPQQLSFWQKFTRACVELAGTIKNKILSLFKKQKIAAPVPPPPPPIINSKQAVRVTPEVAAQSSQIAQMAQAKQGKFGDAARRLEEQKAAKQFTQPSENPASVKDKVKFFEEQRRKKPGTS